MCASRVSSTLAKCKDNEGALERVHMQWTTYLSQIRGDAGEVSGELDPEILASLSEDKESSSDVCKRRRQSRF